MNFSLIPFALIIYQFLAKSWHRLLIPRDIGDVISGEQCNFSLSLSHRSDAQVFEQDADGTAATNLSLLFFLLSFHVLILWKLRRKI